MASSRAEEVAEILWELKRADKVATFSSIADRAGFSAGANGRTIRTCLKTVRRDWPHLQWWRAIQDDGLLEKGSEQEEKFREAGFELGVSADDENAMTVNELEQFLMNWNEPAEEEAAEEASADE